MPYIVQIMPVPGTEDTTLSSAAWILPDLNAEDLKAQLTEAFGEPKSVVMDKQTAVDASTNLVVGD